MSFFCKTKLLMGGGADIRREKRPENEDNSSIAETVFLKGALKMFCLFVQTKK